LGFAKGRHTLNAPCKAEIDSASCLQSTKDRERNPFNLSLEDVVNDESNASKFASRWQPWRLLRHRTACNPNPVPPPLPARASNASHAFSRRTPSPRQVNGIKPRCTHRNEPDTHRRIESTVDLMRATNQMLASAIPQLMGAVRSTNDRIARLESRSRRSGTSRSRGSSALSRRSCGQPALIATPHHYSGERDTYFGGGSSSRPRARTAGTQRSTTSSVAAAARDILGRATSVLQERPGTAKTTKTILSHRLRHGWSGTMRDGDIVKYAGTRIPRREGHSVECTKLIH